MRINIVYAIPRSSDTYSMYSDGFTAAVEVLQERHDVRWLNVHPANDDSADAAALITDADVVVIKSDWGWLPAKEADRALRSHPETASVLLISGSTPPPPVKRMLRYDALVYETEWYAPFVAEHPFTTKAFGIDVRVMRDRGLEVRDYDWAMVGRLAPFKRPERILEKRGSRVVLGDFSSASADLVAQMEEDGVELIGYQEPSKLADRLNRAKNLLVPCTLQGGGERAVLEGRACGCHVEVADDNPKLKSLLAGPVPTYVDYAERLEEVFNAVHAGRKIPLRHKKVAFRAEMVATLLDKVRRLPNTLRIRLRSALNRG